jgi:nucleoside triphosphate pyrophosphatase
MTLGTQTCVVLASQSAARRKVLAGAGIEAIVAPAAIDESGVKRACRAARNRAEDCALALAEAKALKVSGARPAALVIGADQILESGDAWLDKPRDLVEARAQLVALRGRTHDLVAAEAVAKDSAVTWRHVERARMTMRDFSDAFLDAYVAAMGDRLLATVGGYALEDLGAQLFERVEGDYFAILGLPLLPLLGALRERGALAS